MKQFYSILLAACSTNIVIAQQPFTINNIIDPEISHFCDIEYADGYYYCLSNHVEGYEPYREFSKLFMYDDQGRLADSFLLGDYGQQYFQIYKIEEDQIIMAGSITDTGCLSHLVMAQVHVPTKQVQILSSHPLCMPGRITRRMQFVSGINGKVFIEGASGARISTENGNRTFVFELLPDFQLKPVFTNLTYTRHFSVDFSRKGYLLKDAFFIDYFDTNFVLVNQRYNILDDYESDEGMFSYPLGQHFIVDQSWKSGGTPKGEAIRALDKFFYIKRLAVISPNADWNDPVSFPEYGGLAFHGDTIWSTSLFGHALGTHVNYFSITRLDTNLQIQCQQFVGFDYHYRIYGITPLKEGGCIVFGQYLQHFMDYWEGGEEVFAYRSDACETTGINDPGLTSSVISVYPNPTVNTIQFSISGFEPVELRIEFVNTEGMILQVEQDLNREIGVQDFVSGQYFYRILDGDKLVGAGSWVKQ